VEAKWRLHLLQVQIHSRLCLQENKLVFFDTSLEAQSKLKEKFPAAKMAPHLKEPFRALRFDRAQPFKPQVLVRVAMGELANHISPSQ
jgi:hypothetical protein